MQHLPPLASGINCWNANVYVYMYIYIYGMCILQNIVFVYTCLQYSPLLSSCSTAQMTTGRHATLTLILLTVWHRRCHIIAHVCTCYCIFIFSEIIFHYSIFTFILIYFYSLWILMKYLKFFNEKKIILNFITNFYTLKFATRM